ncbi:unnamed protein product [Effrenium voratum]|uniref:Uncharacterized protein n=1 Tax=Effrenium voratum TaxID=2562239 RepID=A0AA36IKM3_9DINO|nr:unnamed protein product [Effrenium voratum]
MNAENASDLNLLQAAARQTSAGLPNPQKLGYKYMATTTRYGHTSLTSCGGLDTIKIVKGTGYYAVASAENMQGDFERASGCWCGKDGGGGGTAGMGCGACGKGRFIYGHPQSYPMYVKEDAEIFQKEIKFIVIDTCTHQAGNLEWCEGKAGKANQYGALNHLDFADPPPKFDHYYFAFSPEPCPAELEHRFAAQSKCKL